jgi:hypothetical protein
MMWISMTTVCVLVLALIAVSAEAGPLSDSSRAGEHPAMLAQFCCQRMAAANDDLPAFMNSA